MHEPTLPLLCSDANLLCAGYIMLNFAPKDQVFHKQIDSDVIDVRGSVNGK